MLSQMYLRKNRGFLKKEGRTRLCKGSSDGCKNKKQRESNPSREALSRTVAAGSSPDGEVLPEAKGKEWLPEFTWRDSKGSRDGCSGSSPEGTETEQKDPTERQRPEEQKDSSKPFASAIGSLSYGRGNTASVWNSEFVWPALGLTHTPTQSFKLQESMGI